MGRLPPNVAEQTIKQLARFLTTSTMPSVTSEAAVLANSAGWMHPELTAKHIIGPMLTRLESELEGVPTLDSSPAKGLSKVQLTYSIPQASARHHANHHELVEYNMLQASVGFAC